MIKKNEKMKVTLKDFKNNPFGKGVTAFNNSSVKESLENRYNGLITNGKKVEVAGVYLHKGDYYIHLLIPSESERPNNYDVVVRLRKDGILNTSQFLSTSTVQFFSNCPSFTYSFAWVYKQHGLLIPDLIEKFDNIDFKKEPEVRNPYGVVNYDKSIFFACHFLLSNMRYLNKAHLEALSRKTNITNLYDKVRICSKIEFEIKKETEILRHKKNEEKKREASAKKRETPNIAVNRGNTVGVIKPRTASKNKITGRKGSKKRIQARK